MTLLNFVIYTLWVVPIVLQDAIIFGMVRHKLVKSFPVFFTYTLWVLFSTTGLLFFRPTEAFSITFIGVRKPYPLSWA